MKKPTDRLTNIANAAFNAVVEDVIERAERTGTPIILWEEGRVVEVDPKVMRARLKKRKKKKDT